mgnify:CR=1 FL=1
MNMTKSEMKKLLLQIGITTAGRSIAELAQLCEDNDLELIDDGDALDKLRDITDALPTPMAPMAPMPPMPQVISSDPLTLAISAIVDARMKAHVPDAPQVDEQQIIDLIKVHSKAPQKIEIHIDDKPPYKMDSVHKAFKDCLDLISLGINVQLVGPAGSGKTTLAQQLHEAWFASHEEKPSFGFTGAIAQEYKLLGFVNALGVYIETEFFKRYTQGGVFLFDEFDGSNPTAILSFNQALANDSCDFPHGVFNKHPNFVAISACNTFGTGADREYVGRFQQDAAALERWVPVEIDYDEELEMTFTDNLEWCLTVQKYRKAIQTLKIRHICSPRATINGAKLLARGWDQAKVEKHVIWKGLDTSTINKIKAA